MWAFRRYPARVLSVALLGVVALEVLGLVYLLRLPFSRITVLNYDREEDLYWTPRPKTQNDFVDSRGVTQVLVGPEYAGLRDYRKAVLAGPEAPDLQGAASDLERLVLLRKWARGQYDFNPGSGKIGMFDYQALLRNRNRAGGSLGESGLCDAFATLYAGAALAFGYPARVVHLSTTAGTDSQGHYTVEVFVPDLGRWVVMDPLHNCYYAMGGRPLSALELHRLAREGRALSSVTVTRDGATTEPVGLPIDNYYRHFQIVSRTDFETHRLYLFGRRLLFLNWVGDGGAPMGRQEAVLRVVLFFVWPGLGLVVTALVILASRPRTSLMPLSGKKPIRPELRE